MALNIKSVRSYRTYIKIIFLFLFTIVIIGITIIIYLINENLKFTLYIIPILKCRIHYAF